MLKLEAYITALLFSLISEGNRSIYINKFLFAFKFSFLKGETAYQHSASHCSLQHAKVCLERG